jgi:hypothetical protein
MAEKAIAKRPNETFHKRGWPKVAEWLFEVNSDKDTLGGHQAYCMALSMLNTVLNNLFLPTKKTYQLYSITCLNIAIRFFNDEYLIDERGARSVKGAAWYCAGAYTSLDVERAQREILAALDWRLYQHAKPFMDMSDAQLLRCAAKLIRDGYNNFDTRLVDETTQHVESKLSLKRPREEDEADDEAPYMKFVRCEASPNFVDEWRTAWEKASLGTEAG